MSSNLIDGVSIFRASNLNAKECRDIASEFYDRAKELDKQTRTPRYETQETGHHWDKCYGVYDHKEDKFVMRDTVKRHCISLTYDLNLALDLEYEAGKASVDHHVSDT